MKRHIILAALITLILSSCKPHREVANANSSSPKPNEQTSLSRTESHEPCINLNTATAEDLKKLPGIGEVMARRVIDYREHHGRFRRLEEIIIVEGFSEKKYRAISERLCVE